jgi:DNA polymerase III subunit gamma/tau
MAKNTPSTTTDPAPTAEGYTVLARRYRPQTFADLVGQEGVARALANAIKTNRVAHAYLFTGARGVGKTSAARILAKALNCVHGPTDTPCGKCEICQSIASGDDVDVLEIDGASNNGVDDIRELRGNTQYSPSRSRFRIYIIDEVHMLSKGAFNALLKTLEEPPPHVKFILATTEVDKVPITILSRCQRFDFAGIPLPRIVERLRSIVEAEHMQADDEALELVARRAGGSMRDAQSLLDQLLAFGGDQLTAEQVHSLLGTAGDDRIVALADAVLAQNAKVALDLLEDAVVSGLQLGELLDQLIAYWRDLMVVHCSGDQATHLSVPRRLREQLTKQAKITNLDTILAGLDVLSATKARLKTSNHGRTLLEMALVRLGRLGDLQPLPQLAHWLGQLRFDSANASVARAMLPEGVKKKPLTPLAPASSTSVPAEATLALAEENLGEIWGRILETVGALLAADLKKANLPAIFGPNTLVIRFPQAYTKAGDNCQTSGNMARVEEALKKITGRAWTLRVETIPTTAVAASALRVPSPEAPSPVRAPRRNQREQAEKEPLVKRVLDVMGAQVLRVDEGFAAQPPEIKSPALVNPDDDEEA